MSEKLTITLAGKDYTIMSLTIDQLEDLHIGLVRGNELGPEAEAKAVWAQNRELLAVALREEHPDMTPEAIAKLRVGTVHAVKAAVKKILEFSGLILAT